MTLDGPRWPSLKKSIRRLVTTLMSRSEAGVSGLIIDCRVLYSVQNTSERSGEPHVTAMVGSGSHLLLCGLPMGVVAG